MPFAKSFKNFVDTGCFKLIDSELTFEQLNQINSYLHENPTADAQLHLTNITLTVTTQEIPEFPNERIEQGAVTSREAPNRYLSTRELDRVNFYGVYSHHARFISMGSGAAEASQQHQSYDPRKLIEDKFRSFFTETSWSSINLNKVGIFYNGENFLLSSDFIYNLLRDLGNKKILSELKIKDSAFNPAWIYFLIRNSSLKILGFEINYSVDEYLKELCLILEENSQLIELDLGDTDISVIGYHYLNKLLDQNYRIKKITLERATRSWIESPVSRTK